MVVTVLISMPHESSKEDIPFSLPVLQMRMLACKSSRSHIKSLVELGLEPRSGL